MSRWARIVAWPLTLALLSMLVLLTGCPRSPAGGPPSEHCLDCHRAPHESPGGAHATATTGCAACHLGDKTATDNALAHAGMEREPGALRTVDRTCGVCHPAETARLRTSLMTTGRGMVGVDRFAFGEIARPDTDETLGEVLATHSPTPAQDHLRRLCAGCHLGSTRANRDDAIRSGGSGCGACHGGRSSADTKGSPSRGDATPAAGAPVHPPVDSRVSGERCADCHSRSGRISLSYRGLAEVATNARFDERLPDGRPVKRLEPDAHHRAGLACVDCHLHTEVMGDGQAWRHASQQVEVTCEACHSPSRTALWRDVRDPITLRLLQMRGETRAGDERVPLGERGTPLWNVRPRGARWVMTAKGDGREHPIPPTPNDLEHHRKGHERLTCTACHAAWAPDCRTCHTTFDPNGRQWDFGRAAEAPGAWREHAEAFGWGAPALGVNDRGRIAPAIPGMLAHLDARAAGGADRHVRYLAFLDPHTTTRTGRTCQSCHVDDPATRGARFLPAGRPLDETERKRLQQAELDARAR